MNLPNKVTLLRIFLIPAFVFIYIVQPFGETTNIWLSLILFSLAAITDAIDGYLARKMGLVTNFGKLMDPLADKLLVSSALILFTAAGILPAWATILLISREFYISGIRQLALEQRLVLAASSGGKIKTIFQMTLIIYILLPFHVLVYDIVIWILLIVTLVVSVLSAIDYTRKNIAIFK